MKRKSLNLEEIRDKTIKLSCDSGAGHLASSLSIIEILTVLFKEFLKFDSKYPIWKERDRFILSKGHGAYSYYIILNKLGIIPDYEIEHFYTDQSSLKGCVCHHENYMLEASTGSLGHGLPIAVGMAWSFKIQNKSNKVVCIVGDGEMQEGSNYESLLFAHKHKLDNLMIIIDANKLQGMDFTSDVGISSELLWDVVSKYTSKKNSFNINGHNIRDITSVLNYFYSEHVKDGFTLMFANTVKGNGMKMIENKKNYHYRCPVEDGYVYGKSEV